MPKFQILSATLLAAALLTTPVAAATYTIKPLRIAGIGPVTPSGMSRRGVIYGTLTTKAGRLRAYTMREGHATIYNVGKASLLETVSCDNFEIAGLEQIGDVTYWFRMLDGKLQRAHTDPGHAVALNDSGIFVGTSTGKRGLVDRGYSELWTESERRPQHIKIYGTNGTFFTGINVQGVVSGYYRIDQHHTIEGFTLADGQMTRVQVPGYGDNMVVGINDTGSLAITAMNVGGSSAPFIDVGGVFTQIAPPGAIETNLIGINNQNAAYGMYETSDDIFHAFVYKAGAYSSFDAPQGAIFNSCALNGMDGHGALVGYYLVNTNPVGFKASCSGTDC